MNLFTLNNKYMFFLRQDFQRIRQIHNYIHRL